MWWLRSKATEAARQSDAAQPINGVNFMHMIRNLFFAAPVAAALALSGCAGGVTPATVSATIAQVQQATVLTCSFLPTAATVAGILSGGNPLVTTAAAIAQAICTAVTAKGARKGGPAPMVGNVVVHGRWVK